MSAHNGVKQKKITVTTNQKELTPDVAAQNVKVKQKKITEENKSTATIKQKELTPDAASQNDPSALKFHQQKITEEKKSTLHEDDKAMDIEDIPVTHIYAKSPQKKIREENKEMVTTNQKESTPDAASQNDPPVVKFHQQKITEGKKSTLHEDDKAMNIEDIPVTHVYAKSQQNKKREENKASTATNQEMDDKLPTNGKLTYQEHKTAYPWAHAASNNTFIKTDLAAEIKYVNHRNIEKFLTTNMKKHLTKTIKLPSYINHTIEKKIKYLLEEAYRCCICSMIFKRKYNAIHHV